MSSASEESLRGLRQQIAEIVRGTTPKAVAPAADEPSGASPAAGPWLRREQELGHQASAVPAPGSSSAAQRPKFLPLAPRTLAETGLSESDVEALILKWLLQVRVAAGTEIARQIALPFHLVDKLLGQLKERRLLVYKQTASLHDFVYELTEQGTHYGRRQAEQCSYCDAAPVSLGDYVAAIEAQSIHRLKVARAEVEKALADLSLNDTMLDRVGRAIRSGKGLFLYGAPGNGKTSIAERITRAYGLSIWIPRALNAFGEIVRLYDPSNHAELPLSDGSGIAGDEKVDERWVRIRRPTIIVGGELTLDSLEIRSDRSSGIAEAPLQLKSNCGTLVIDDFGRQRVAPAELLNRWIVPLEKRYDFLSLASGRKIQVPFDQFVIFSTNLEPRDLVDEAFLRRIPYKIDVCDPSEDEFRKLFLAQASRRGVGCAPEEVDYLFQHCYRSTKRPFRFCHARDLLHQIEVFCEYRGEPPRLSRAAIEAAASNYFSMV